MTMSLIRRWFDTTDPVGPSNAYVDEATVEFEIAG
jgi:hypothetical protein